MHPLFGIELPVIQAPMAGVQGSALALAVGKAGGLGSLPCAMLSPDALRRELDALRAGIGRSFNLNFFCHVPPAVEEAREHAWRAALAPYYREFAIDPPAQASAASRTPFDEHAADIVEAFRPAVVSFHFGLPAPDLLARVRSWGSLVLASATTIDEAHWLQMRGVDAVIAQGLEAGGHRGHFLSEDITLQSGTSVLVAQCVRELTIPVIAAGGIGNARDVAAALALGASAVQVGTGYLLCPEATVHAVHRRALESVAARETELTNVFSGGIARGIVNRLMRELGPINPSAPPFPLAAGALAPLRAHAERAGSGDFSPLWAGQNASGCRAIGAALLTRALGGV
ncbi:MAG: nitronate monooxygenase [Dokdonella sp.]